MPTPARDDAYPPTYSKRFTSFASQLVLHGTSSSAPSGILHLPCQLVIEVDTADTILAYKDAASTTVSMNFDAVGTYVLRMAPSSIETTTTVAAVTVFWQGAVA